MADDQFNKKIILLNKEKIYLSANAISNEFLREIIAMNVISLWKCQEAISRAIEVTSHDNCYSFAAKLSDILLLIKYIIEDSLFYE